MYLHFAFSGSDLQQVIKDSCVEVDSDSSDFWIMVAALKVGEINSVCMTSFFFLAFEIECR